MNKVIESSGSEKNYELMMTFDEICVKGKNQNFFLGKLFHHLLSLLREFHSSSVKIVKDQQRYLIRSDSAFTNETLLKLTKVPGLHSFHLMRGADLSLESALQFILEELMESKEKGTLPKTFKVFASRANKKFEMKSGEIGKWMGHHLLERFPELKVDVKNPELKILVKVQKKHIYVGTKTYYSLSGLPLGTSGHGLTLLSGGFDSPVASYLMFKRGLSQSFVFFHAYPFVGDEITYKIIDLVKFLAKFQQKSYLYILPFGEIQELIVEKCKPSYRTLLFRRYMLYLSTILAKEIEAEALITGDSLGQVASQTLPNLNILEEGRVEAISILRPLLGYNKNEIIELARKVGSFDLSMIPQEDACSLLADKYPVTKPHLGYWSYITKELDPLILSDQVLSKKRKLYIDWNESVTELSDESFS